MHGMYGGMSHLGSGRTEILFHFFFDHQSLRGLGASDPFVKVSRNLRIDFPYPAVQNHQLFLEKSSRKGCQRHDSQHPQGQTEIDGQHDHHCAQYVGHIPDTVHQSPGNQGADPVGIAHHSCVNIADAVLIIIGKGQGLQMIKACPLHVSAHVHLDLACLVGRDGVGDHLKGQYGDISRNKTPQFVQRPLCNKMVQCIPLKKRQDNVYQPARQPQDYHTENDRAVGF